MEITNATMEALHLLLSGDAELWGIIGVSLLVSGTALLVASPPALALAWFVVHREFAGRRTLIAILQGLLSFPTVAVGLVLYILLSRQGPLGAWGLLFSPTAMALGQMFIAFPVLCVFAISALQKNDQRLLETVRTFGGGFWRALFWSMREARFGLAAALLAGFGRVISEVGCALLVGGNIANSTRTLTTAITLKTSNGMFAEGIALGIVLVALALATGLLLAALQGGGQREQV